MTVIYFVRHAHADWVPNEQRPLSQQGAADALRVADLLREKPISVIYASPARRAQQTVEPLAEQLGLPVLIVDELREQTLSEVPVTDFRAAVEQVWRDPHFAFPGGESNQVAQQRGVRAIEALQRRHPDEQIVVGTHGRLLALIFQHYDPSLGLPFWQSLTMPDVFRLEMHSSTLSARQRLWP